MTDLGIIADDLTGACDVASSFADAGVSVRVFCDPDDAGTAAPGLLVRNTQSRGVSTAVASERVTRAVRRSAAPILLKKIDTALRGHLGAELDATLDALNAPAAFIVAAIPAAKRVTRAGHQWFHGIPLAATEFAGDPEGPGAESAIAAVIARESDRATTVVALDDVRGGDLAAVLRARMRAGARYLVVDAETDRDVMTAAAAIFEMPRPLCVAGSIAVASALAALARAGFTPTVDDSRAADATAASHERGVESCGPVATPALVVCGSLHSTAHAQLDALVASGVAIALEPANHDHDLASEAARAFAAGSDVVLSAPRAGGPPGLDALRATEQWLAEAAHTILAATKPRSLVTIGGETSYAVLRRLGATRLDVRGCFLPLVVVSTIVNGLASGIMLVTKCGSGGDPRALVELLGQDVTRPRTVAAVNGGHDARR